MSGPKRKQRRSRKRWLAEERLLGQWLPTQRWYRGKTRSPPRIRVTELLECPTLHGAKLVLLEARRVGEEPELYVTALGTARGDDQQRRAGATADVSDDPRVAEWLFSLVRSASSARTSVGTVKGSPAPALLASRFDDLPARPLKGTHTNSGYFLGRRAFLKLIRRLDDDSSVELEVLAALAPNAPSLGVPLLLGSLELTERARTRTLAIVTARIPGRQTLWQLTRKELRRLQALAAKRHDTGSEPISAADMRAFLKLVGCVGERLAALHVALSGHPALGRKRMSTRTHDAACRSALRFARQCRRTLAALLPSLSEPTRSLAIRFLEAEDAVTSALGTRNDHADLGQTIRIHGDLHLAQILHSAKGCAFIDFEGEPARSPAERRRRRSPLVDVAGVLRSFSYAAQASLREVPRDVDASRAARVQKRWLQLVSQAFLEAYERAIASHDLVPKSRSDRRKLLEAFVLEKALYEVRYELDHRPDWVSIPLQGVLDSVNARARIR